MKSFLTIATVIGAVLLMAAVSAAGFKLGPHLTAVSPSPGDVDLRWAGFPNPPGEVVMLVITDCRTNGCVYILQPNTGELIEHNQPAGRHSFQACDQTLCSNTAIVQVT